MPRPNDPFEIIERLNDNSYKVDLPGDYGVPATFNIPDLSPCLDDDDDYLEDFKVNFSSQGENDGGPSLIASYGPNKSNSNWKELVL